MDHSIIIVIPCWNEEQALLAAPPSYNQGAVFLSKYWDAHATGRKVITCRFSGTMKGERELVQTTSLDASLNDWLRLIKSKIWVVAS